MFIVDCERTMKERDSLILGEVKLQTNSTSQLVISINRRRRLPRPVQPFQLMTGTAISWNFIIHPTSLSIAVDSTRACKVSKW